MSARLNQARLRIDEIDREIVRLMAERMTAVRRIGSEKNSDPGAALRDDARERRVVANWLKEAGAHDHQARDAAPLEGEIEGLAERDIGRCHRPGELAARD